MDSLLACRIYSKLSRALLLAQRNLDGLSIDQKNTSYAGSIRLNYPDECEEAVNKQINVELNAYYAYQGLANYFQHPLKGLIGFSSMFLFCTKEELEHASKLMAFQNKRAGHVVLRDIKAPECAEWTPEKAIEKAIEMELEVTQRLHELQSLASEKNDVHLSDFIESEFLQEQYTGLQELQLLLTRVKLVGPSFGIYMIDRELHEKFKNKRI